MVSSDKAERRLLPYERNWDAHPGPVARAMMRFERELEEALRDELRAEAVGAGIAEAMKLSRAAREAGMVRTVSTLRRVADTFEECCLDEEVCIHKLARGAVK